MYGKPIRISIDDKLPATINSAKTAITPKFAKRGPNGSWWVPILEKASAKYYVNYMNMNGGWMSESLYMLTGMPNTGFSTIDLTEDQIFEKLTIWDKKQYVMTAAVNRADGVDKKNLVDGHAYTIIGTAVAPNGQRLVKLRNPWGTEQYIGPYSDTDTVNMTAEVKAALNYTTGNDGIFHMTIQDFKAYVN